MTDPTDTPHTGSDGLWRWLVGGLVGGCVVLGLLVAAYAIGYHHGEHQSRTAAPPPTASTTTAPTTTTAAPTTTTTTAAPTTTAPAAGSGSVPVTAALVAQGKSLYQSDGCASCHSLTSSAGAGPGFGGLAGSTVTLSTGATVTADDPYLERSIVDPDAQIVKGFQPAVMPAAISGFDLGSKPDDVRALVAFIKSQK